MCSAATLTRMPRARSQSESDEASNDSVEPPATRQRTHTGEEHDANMEARPVERALQGTPHSEDDAEQAGGAADARACLPLVFGGAIALMTSYAAGEAARCALALAFNAGDFLLSG